MENILFKNEFSSIEKTSLETATEKFATNFGKSIHMIFNRCVSDYVDKNPTDKHTVRDISEFDPTIEINDNIITFNSKGVNLVLENKDNNWDVKNISCEIIFAPHEVTEKITEEVNRIKDSFANQFNNEIRLVS